MNHHALAVLQYPEALAVVAGHASSTLGSEAVQALRPSAQASRIESELHRGEEMALLLARTEPWSMPRIPNARAAVRKAAVEGAALDGIELWEVVILLHASKAVRGAVDRDREAWPLITELAQPLAALDKLEQQITQAIDE